MQHYLNSVGFQALKSNHSVVTYEVMLSIQRLVNKYGLELQDPAWDLVLSIIEAIIGYIGLLFCCTFININSPEYSSFNTFLHYTLKVSGLTDGSGSVNG